MRYVSLSTDADPAYAVHAAVAARLWLRLGYKTIMHVEDTERWNSKFGAIVLEELRTIEAAIVKVPKTHPLSVANTMRASRLVAPWVNGLFQDDFILMADVDMYPLSRTFFSSPSDFTVLRALYASWLSCSNPPPQVDWSLVTADKWRFQMCYAGATVQIWREMWSLPLHDSSAALRALLEGTPKDSSDFDEAKLSYAFLNSPRSAGDWETIDPDGHWKRGQLRFVEPMRAPLLSQYYNMPRGLVGPYDESWSRNPGAIDFIPPRFALDDKPWWCLEVVKHHWPEETTWLAEYQDRVTKAWPTARWR